MIYVRRNPALIPDKLLKVAERAQLVLEALPPGERADFIKNKSTLAFVCTLLVEDVIR